MFDWILVVLGGIRKIKTVRYCYIVLYCIASLVRSKVGFSPLICKIGLLIGNLMEPDSCRVWWLPSPSLQGPWKTLALGPTSTKSRLSCVRVWVVVS